MKHVVVVDDEQMIDDYLQTLLRREGYRGTSFSNPKEALGFIKRNHREISLVVVDLVMPYMTGSQLADELMKTDESIPLILLTGQLLCPDKTDLPDNIKRVLQKPMTRQQFLKGVEEVIGSS